jgi:hypothetical protein
MNYIENARKLRLIIEKAVQSLPEEEAVEGVELYPTWEKLCEKSFVAEQPGYKFSHEGILYKTVQTRYTFVSHYVPGVGTESLFDRIDEDHTGTLEDPIPYGGNMALVNGLYYIQDSVVYHCTRDSGVPVYNPLSDLVGLYVELA